MSSPSPARIVEDPPCAARVQRHIITCEFPPQSGGVGDYSYLLAKQLAAAGDDVHVWCSQSEAPNPQSGMVVVHRDLGRKSPRDLLRLDRSLSDFPPPRRLLVQWVPHGYGYKSLNLLFCLWLWKRSKVEGDSMELMVHEAFLDFPASSLRQSLAAVVHRIMITLLLAAASKVWLSTSAWEAKLRPYCMGRGVPFHWLPIPSNIPISQDSEGIASIRQRYSPSGGVILGHFGTFGRGVADILHKLIPLIFDNQDNHSLALIGRGSCQFRESLLEMQPQLASRIFATGPLHAQDVSLHIQACDMMIQPYADGITTRRTSTIVSLAHGLAVVTTHGHSTEPFWFDAHAVALESVTDILAIARRVESLIPNGPERRRLAEAARILYRDRFHLNHTVAAIRSE